MHRSTHSFLFCLVLLLQSVCFANTLSTDSSLLFKAATKQTMHHLNYVAINVNNTSNNIKTIKTLSLTVPKSLQHQITICDAKGSNCDSTYASSCLNHNARLLAQKQCVIWFKANKQSGLVANKAFSLKLSITSKDPDNTIHTTHHDIHFSYNNNLYVAGMFTQANGKPANRIARWDGSNWYSLGITANNGTNGQINSIADYKGDLYVGGMFTQAGSAPKTSMLAIWNGSNWQSAQSPLIYPNYVHGITTMGNKLYIGTDNGLYSTDGHSYQLIPDSELYSPITHLSSTGSILYVANIGNNLVSWNGTTWSGLNANWNAWITTATVYENKLYVGGKFTNRGTTPGNYIAYLDANNKWQPLIGKDSTNGVGYFVNVLLSANNQLYVGGQFGKVGNTESPLIAKWDGHQWSAILGPNGEGLGGISVANVDALAMTNKQLYVGGGFDSADGTSVNNIVMWDGQAWHTLQQGVTGGFIPILSMLIEPSLSIQTN